MKLLKKEKTKPNVLKGKVQGWWTSNHRSWLNKFSNGARRWATRILIIGILFNLIVHFCPEIGDKFPVLYAIFDGCLQFMEFSFKSVLKLGYSLFTGKFISAWREYDLEFRGMINQLLTWLASL